MQPTLVLSAVRPGLVYMNGSFAGELSAGQPLLRPCAPTGAVYLEFRPLENGWLPMARRLVFSSCAPLVQSAAQAEGLNIVLWPGGICEIEFEPAPLPHVQHFQIAGRSFTLETGSMRLMCGQRFLAVLPAGAQLPRLQPFDSGAGLTGECDGGGWLLTSDENFSAATGLLQADSMDFLPGDRIRALSARDDLAGHAVLETWQLTPEGLMLLSSEPAWLHGAPRRPESPGETAQAAAEALLAGEDAEAAACLSPALHAAAVQDLLRGCDLCLPMKYAPPGGRPCVGLLSLEAENMARVRPLYYSAVPCEGGWQLETLEIE